MKVIFEVNMTGDVNKTEDFIGQVSEHLVSYIKQHNFIVESIDRKITFDEEEQTQMGTVQVAPQPTVDTINDMPMQMAQEKMSKLKEFYNIKK